jgi:hypothetical protein
MRVGNNRVGRRTCPWHVCSISLLLQAITSCALQDVYSVDLPIGPLDDGHPLLAVFSKVSPKLNGEGAERGALYNKWGPGEMANRSGFATGEGVLRPREGVQEVA